MAKYLLYKGADYNNLKFKTKTVALDGKGQQIHTNNNSPLIKDNKELNILDFLRDSEFPLNSKEYKIKMEIVEFLKNKGLDYWKYPIPEKIKSRHKNDIEYLLKY